MTDKWGSSPPRRRPEWEPEVTRSDVAAGARTVGKFSLGTIVLFAVGLVLLVVLSTMAIFGWGLFQRSTANFRGETAQRERVLADPNYRIAAYEQFYDLCAQVQTNEATIKQLEKQAAKAPEGSLNRTVLEQQLAGTTATRAQNINQYNADARKTDTRAHFLASDLPYQLNINAEETSCTVP